MPLDTQDERSQPMSARVRESRREATGLSSLLRSDKAMLEDSHAGFENSPKRTPDQIAKFS